MSIHEIPVDSKRASNVPEPMVYEHPIPESDIDSDAIKVLRRLVRHDHTAYLVGGGVRDLLLGRPPKDFDVATSARPNEVRSLFRNCRIIGRRFRLAHILFSGGKVIETATFRREPNADEEGGDLLIRHDNVFGDPHEDAIRRDFTINGLFYDIERGEVIDYVGGVPDLEKGILRTIGDPNVRLKEDPVRILRAIKFSARLDLGIETNLYDSMLAHRTDLRRAAAPRVLEEILRLLRGGAAHRSIFLMWDSGVLAEILPELVANLDDGGEESTLLWRRLQCIDAMKADGQTPTDALLLAVLLAGPIHEWLDGARDPQRQFLLFFEDIAERLAVPRRIKDRLQSIAAVQSRLRSGKVGNLARRDFFLEAAAFARVDFESRGEPIPAWLKPTRSRK